MASMPPRNVSDAEAAARAAVAAIIVGLSIGMALYAPTPIVVSTAVLGLSGAILLMKSAVTQYCPIHDAVDATNESVTVGGRSD